MSAATQHICQMRSAPVMEQTRDVEAVTGAVPQGHVADDLGKTIKTLQQNRIKVSGHLSTTQR